MPKIQKFISVVVYNIGEDTFQIFDMVPDKMQKQFSATCNNPKWGSPPNMTSCGPEQAKVFRRCIRCNPSLITRCNPSSIRSLEVNLEAHVSGARLIKSGAILAKTED